MDFTPGEWQIDEWGRKFRMVGNTKEYATIITTTAGDMDPDQLEAYHRQMREQPKERIPSPVEPTGICPFKTGRKMIHAGCEKDCAFYDSTGCAFARPDAKGVPGTQGKYCPIAGRCTEKCAMYRNGCTMRRA